MNEQARDYTGGCLCGAVRYRAEGPPKRVSNCHCRTCQHSSGAPFVSAAAFDGSRFAYTKGEPAYYAASEIARRSFCPACGGRLAFHYNDGEAVSVWLTTLDDPEALTPQRQIWTASKRSWVRLDDSLPSFPREAPRSGAGATPPEGAAS